MPAKKRNRGGGAKGNNNNNNNNHHQKNDPPHRPSTSGNPRDQRNGGIQHHPPVSRQRRINPHDAATLIKNAPVDPSTQIVRHLAIFRLIIFFLLVYTYVKYLPHAELNRHVDSWLTYDQFHYFYDWAPKQGDRGAPFFSLSILTCAVFFGMLSALGGVNGIQSSFQISGWIFLSCFAFRFFTFAHTFSDRHYLLFLLAIITVVSGGGSFFLIFTEVEPTMTPTQQQIQRQKRQRLIQLSEWGAITLRLQYAVVYLFSSFWKLHTDYFHGHILRNHLLGMAQQPTLAAATTGGLMTATTSSGSWFWRLVDVTFGSVGFQIIGMVSFLMDFGMFLVLTFRRPTEETSRSFVLYCTIYHLVVALTIGHKLGYSFSLTCIVGILIFYPIGGGNKANGATTTHNDSASAAATITTTSDPNTIKKRIRNRISKVPTMEEANLVQWIHRYATGSPEARANRKQRLFTLGWLAVQIVLPMRMSFISGGSYPYTGRGYRFSWTMMLHNRQTTINHVGKYTTPGFPSTAVAEKVVPLHLFYVVPECSSSGKALQRRDYMPERAVATEDPRTLPVDSVLTDHHKAFVRSYPRYMVRVAGGVSMLLNRKVPEACGENDNNNTTTTINATHVAAFGVHFAKLNGRGAYCRIFDPTIDLTLSEMARYHQPIWEELWGIAFDKATRHEYMLSVGIGTMDRYIDKHRTSVGIAALGAQRVEYVADRSACLFLRPLALWPNGYPLAIMPLEAPSNAQLVVTARVHSSEAALANLTITAGNQWDILEPPKTAPLKLGVIHSVTAVSIEILVRYNDNNFNPGPRGCADSRSEDILFALFFMS